MNKAPPQRAATRRNIPVHAEDDAATQQAEMHAALGQRGSVTTCESMPYRDDVMDPRQRVRRTAGSSLSAPPFRRDRLPPVGDVLRLLNLESSKPNRSGYVQVRCPIHGENNPSMSVHLERGNWKCFACGEAGGDALELYRRARGLTFIQAARELGAWEVR
jgi:hypothetical protein